MSDKIPGGYYIKARKIKASPVHNMPPYVREIWDYCLREAVHSDGFMGPCPVKRGQLFKTYLDIREDLCWYVGYRKEMYDENQTKKAMKALRKALAIDTTRALGGVLITVMKFDYYQTPSNYERTRVSTHESTDERTTKALRKHQRTPQKTNGFDRFIEHYPRKMALGNAEVVFYEIDPPPELIDEMVEAINKQKKSENWIKEDGKYIPLPENWLRGKRWLDQVEISTVVESESEKRRKMEEQVARLNAERDL